MAEVITSTGEQIYSQFVDPLLEWILNVEVFIEGYASSAISVVAQLCSLITIDWTMARSLAKGFLIGSVVIFFMCYLDWHSKRRQHDIDVTNKVGVVHK